MKGIKGCPFKNYCNCNRPLSVNVCERCVYFKSIDSGIGYCIGLPKVETVPWCKIPCALFKNKIIKEST